MTIMNDKLNSKLRLDFLDGIRGWASIMVLLFHLIVNILSNINTAYQTKYLKFITDGHLAVFIFFVLSGFALSISFIERPHRITFPYVIIARYFRLLIPIFLSSFIAYLLLKENLIFSVQAGELVNSKKWLGAAYDFQASLIHLLKFCFFDAFFQYESSTSYNKVLWTMSIEYTGSLLIYLSIGIFRQQDSKIHLLPLIGTFIYLFRKDPSISCFLLGYFLAEVYFIYVHDKKIKYLNLLSIFLFIASILLSTFYKGMESDQYVTLLAFMLVSSVTFSPLLQNLFTCRLSRFLGRISFPLYLMHMIVICSWSSYLIIHLPLYAFDQQMVANIVLVTTIILCILSAWIISPIEVFSPKFSKYLSKKLIALVINLVNKIRFTDQGKSPDFANKNNN